MRRNFLRLLLIAVLGIAGFTLAAPPQPAAACPMCKVANESGDEEGEKTEENARPKAYMYSILFMLAMPPCILAAFGVGFYRLSKRKAAEELANGGEGSHHIAGGTGEE